MHQVVGGDAGSNHHFDLADMHRAANHCVLDTLLVQSKLGITLGGRVESWSGMMVWRVRGRGGGSTQHYDAWIGRTEVGGDTSSNHHFRAAKHRVLDTLVGQSKLRITLGGRVESHREV